MKKETIEEFKNRGGKVRKFTKSTALYKKLRDEQNESKIKHSSIKMKRAR
jgi:hypothetical protein